MKSKSVLIVASVPALLTARYSCDQREKALIKEGDEIVAR